MRKLILSCLYTVILMLVASVAYGESYAGTMCEDQRFTCVRIQRGETWQNFFPDPATRRMVMRLNHVNIPLHSGMIIAVPNNLLKTNETELAPFSQKIPAPGEKLLVFSPSRGAWAAYSPDGQLVRWGPASGGRDYCPDLGHRCHTVTGVFRIYSKGGPGCYSTKFPLPYGGAPMPYCMYFHGGYAFHASNDVPGYNASHGCVRLFYEDAQWLNQQFIDLPGSGSPGTKVIINQYSRGDDDDY